MNRDKERSLNMALAFMERYKSLREKDYPLETYYNIGRVYSQISFFPEAKQYYEKVLMTYNNMSNINTNF